MSLYGKPDGVLDSHSGGATLDGKAVALIKYLLAATAVNALADLYQWRTFAEHALEFLPYLLPVFVRPGMGIALLLLLLFKRRRIFAVALVVCPSAFLLLHLPALSPTIDWREVWGYYHENFSWVLQVVQWIPWVAIFPFRLFHHEPWPYFVELAQEVFHIGVMIWLLRRVNASQPGKIQYDD